MQEAPEALIQQAQSSLAVGDAAGALTSLNQLLQSYPRHAQGLLRRGFVRVRLGEPSSAVADWEAAMEIEPGLLRQMDSPDFRPLVEASLQKIKEATGSDAHADASPVIVGRAYAALGRYAQALQAYTSVLRQDPEQMEAGLGSAQVYLKLGQNEQALQVLQKLYEIHPNNGNLCARLARLYMASNSVAQATRFFERATALQPDDWASHLALGQIFVRQGKHEQATTRFQKTLSLKSDCAAALVGLAECCKELYRFEAAISYYQQAVAIDPGDLKALTQMGSLCIQLGGLDLGIETLQQALQFNAADADIYSNLAKAYQQKGDLPTAAGYFAKVTELNPKDYFAAYSLGLIFRTQGKLEEACEAFGRAADLRPNDSQYQYQWSRALLERGKVREALAAAGRAVSLNPNSKESQLLYGRCCLEAERYAPAAEAFRQAIHIDAQNVEAHYQLAVALLNLNQIDDARQSFGTTLRLAPAHAPSQLGLGHVARRSGQWQQAADHYRQAIGLDLTLQTAMEELTRLYLEREQREEINEFVRLLCAARRDDPNFVQQFLPRWLATLTEQGQIDLAADSLDFVLDLFPDHPETLAQHAALHSGAAEASLAAGDEEAARAHLQELRRLHPHHEAVLRLGAELAPPAAPTLPPPPPLHELSYDPEPPVGAEALSESEPVLSPSRLLPPPEWHEAEPAVSPLLPMEPLPVPLPSGDATEAPVSRLLPPPSLDDDLGSWLPPSEPAAVAAPLPAEERPSGLLPPPPLDDDLSRPLPVPGRSEGSGLLPPPAVDGALLLPSSAEEADVLPLPVADSLQLSRLTLEDVPAGSNPAESLADLAQHYAHFARQLESGGWWKQASLCLADARNLRPHDPGLIEQQARILHSWASRLNEQGERAAAAGLSDWSVQLGGPPAEPRAEVSEPLPVTSPEVEQTLGGGWGAAPPPAPTTEAESASVSPEMTFEPKDPLPGIDAGALPPPPFIPGPPSLSAWTTQSMPRAWSPLGGLSEPRPPNLAVPPLEEPEEASATLLSSPKAEALPVPPTAGEPLPLVVIPTLPPPPPPETLPSETAVAAAAPTAPEAAPLAAPAPTSWLLGALPTSVGAEEAESVPPEQGQSEQPEPTPLPARSLKEEEEEQADSEEPDDAPASSEPEPPTSVPERAAEPEYEPPPPGPYRSAEFEVNLHGAESNSELAGLIARYPDDPDVRKAVFRAFADDTPSLLKLFRDLAQEDPDEPYHVLNLARAYTHTGSDSLGVLQYRKYVKMEPTSEGYRELGELYDRLGKAELAQQALRRAELLAEQEAEDDFEEE